jgi:hypothetical protein
MNLGWRLEYDVKTRGNLGRIKYIINKQVGGGYSFMKNETFRVTSRKDTKAKEVEI